MVKLLIYGNRKQDDDIYDISTPEKEAAAYLRVFTTLDEDWCVYTDMNEIEADLYDRAKKGDANAAKTLITKRKSYEYENVRREWAIDPLED